ncbi:MAG TPA: CHAP domain-containing protein [Chloroflexota bacterium]|nr:CHAP domain-containing protein [Chloroflexota bacterium]
MPEPARALRELPAAPPGLDKPLEDGLFIVYRLRRRIFTVSTAALALSRALGSHNTPVFADEPAEYNCVNVVLRDPFWGQYRRIVQRGWSAAGIAPAFETQGWVVNNTPSVGAIMVWPADYAGASSSGHTGVVAEVYGNGRVLVRHENWPYGSPEHAQVFPNLPEYRYVHRPDAITAHAVHVVLGVESSESALVGYATEEIEAETPAGGRSVGGHATGELAAARTSLTDLSPKVAEQWKSDGRVSVRDKDDDKHGDRGKGRDKGKGRR